MRLALLHLLDLNCAASLRNFAYVCREAVIGNNYSLHAVIEMVEPTHRSRLAGEGFKPSKGALVKSQGTERLGKVHSRGVQVWVKEMNESEPLMRCRESATFCQKL